MLFAPFAVAGDASWLNRDLPLRLDGRFPFFHFPQLFPRLGHSVRELLPCGTCTFIVTMPAAPKQRKIAIVGSRSVGLEPLPSGVFA